MILSFFFSPCPNDTFMFDAMLHQKIDTEGLSFVPRLVDIEALNHAAREGEADITKLSYHAFAYVSDRYRLLPAGSALGHGNGPLLVSKRKIYPDELYEAKIAIPGPYTTAVLLLKMAFPQAGRLHEYIFSDIEDAVLTNEMDAGVLIHEGRFTYAQKGLQVIADLGRLWEQRTAQPIPLGGIAMLRKWDADVQQKVARVVRRSVEFARQYPQESAGFVKRYAWEMDTVVTRKHIDLYVTDYSVDLGEHGRKAVDVFFSEALKVGAIKVLPADYLI